MEDATGIDAQALSAFLESGMKNAREKLQWVSTHVTTVPEDIVDSVSRIFGVYVPVIHGENKQRMLGRLLQEIVAESGDISPLDWVGHSSTDFASYATPPDVFPSLSEDEIQITVSLLRHNLPVDLALRLYTLLENLSSPRFAHRRLHLPCLVFPITEVRQKRDPAQLEEIPRTYEVKTDGLHDVLIASDQTLIQFSRKRPTRQKFLLVRPWNRHLLELPDFTDDADEESLEDWSEPESRYTIHMAAIRQRGGEYKRIASDHDIVVQVRDLASVFDLMDIRTIEVL
ncbi:hypothetical protein BDR07DRAFT_1406845 [Suillus spraguei]|nr:hypothetical protein BDR07DRAFT_1406845 [Suillus spraguei]